MAVNDTWGEFNNGINWDEKDTVMVTDTTSKIVNAFKVDFKTKNRAERLIYK